MWLTRILLPIYLIMPRVVSILLTIRKSPYGKTERDQALLLMDQSSKQTTEIVPTEMGDTIDGAWTSDSQWFIFAHTYGDPDKYYSQLLEVSSDGTELRPLTSPFGQSDFQGPIISPDGEKVAFVIDQVSHQTIGLLWLNNGNLSIYQLEPDPRLSLIGEFTVWSPDSQWFGIYKMKY